MITILTSEYRIPFGYICVKLLFKMLDTRQLQGKLWEIKVSQTRIIYVVVDKERVAFLNICKKEKGKAEKTELNRAIKRAKSLGL